MNSKKVNQNESLGHKVRRLRYLHRYDDRSIALSALDRFFYQKEETYEELIEQIDKIYDHHAYACRSNAIFECVCK